MKQLPAILGGEPVVNVDHYMISRVAYTKEDLEIINELLQDGNLSTHGIIRELENDYRILTNRKYGLAHCNGTAALMAGFFALGLQPGDEVITPSATFWASVLPMTWFGAVPIFCESEAETLGPDPRHMESLITSKTKAIVMVHLWGMPCKVDEILLLAKKYNLKVIEDASHAHGAYYKGKPCGSFGDISVFSLQGDKLAPAGEGGVLLCDEYQYFEQACCLGDITRIIELETAQQRFAATSFGLKTRIAPISAAIGKNTLQRLDENNQKRNANCYKFINALTKYGFEFCNTIGNSKRVFFELIAKIPEGLPLSPEALHEALQAEGCMITIPRYPLLHQQPFFTEGVIYKFCRLPEEMKLPEYQNISLKYTEQMNQQMIQIPILSHTPTLIDLYLRAFDRVMSHSQKIQQHWEARYAS